MIVLDTSVISAFSEIGRFNLLGEILKRIEVKAIKSNEPVLTRYEL